jgi:hypothetical protein
VILRNKRNRSFFRGNGFFFRKTVKLLEVSKTFTTFAKEESGEPDTEHQVQRHGNYTDEGVTTSRIEVHRVGWQIETFLYIRTLCLMVAL